MYFGGLRPGEARGVRWEDFEAHYDHEREAFEWRLTPRQSVWRTQVGTPKTESSAKPVPVIETLRAILGELREAEGHCLGRRGYVQIRFPDQFFQFADYRLRNNIFLRETGDGFGTYSRADRSRARNAFISTLDGERGWGTPDSWCGGEARKE